jgi:hypothetical protein
VGEKKRLSLGGTELIEFLMAGIGIDWASSYPIYTL